MTLTEFLLARIAEDEELTPNELATSETNGYRYGAVTLQYGDIRVGRDRWLAECEAKRRIVTWIEDNDPHGKIDMPIAEAYERDVLNLLALPYANHPDYQDEWRP